MELWQNISVKKILPILIISLNLEAICYKEGYTYNCYDDDRLYYSGGMKESNRANAMDARYFMNNVFEYLTITGYGTYYYKSGDEFTGRFLAGKREGYGTMDYKNGSKYSGYWKNDLKNGQGTKWDKNGNKIYSGQYKDGLENGFGTKYDGDTLRMIYEGNWKNGVHHGYGTRYFQDSNWISVSGNFDYGNVEGQYEAKYIYSDIRKSRKGELQIIDGYYRWQGKTVTEYNDGSISEDQFIEGERVDSKYIITPTQAKRDKEQKAMAVAERNAKLEADRLARERKEKLQTEIYNKCILDKIPNSKTESAAELIRKSCREISKDPSYWQLVKYLGIEGIQEIINQQSSNN